MDINTAAKYLEQGYRIKRLTWVAVIYAYNFHGTICGYTDKCGIISLGFSVNDLLADDWVIITDNIVTYFPITYSD